MVKVLLHGCGGKMGRVVVQVIAGQDDVEICAGIDPRTPEAAYPVYAAVNEFSGKADVIIDFSTAPAVPALLTYARETKPPLVLCTTGLSEEMLAQMREAAKETAILRSANMSVGVNLLLGLVKQAAQTLFESGFDIEVVEKHHNQKIDAPSGTALALADAAKEGAGEAMTYVYDRTGKREKRTKNEIGIHAIRGGTIVGEHDVIFAGRDEIVTLSHTAMSKEIFAVGAVKAAKFLAGKPAGLYDMKDVLGL